MPRLTAFSLPEAISNRTILVLTEMAMEASFTDRRRLAKIICVLNKKRHRLFFSIRVVAYM